MRYLWVGSGALFIGVSVVAVTQTNPSYIVFGLFLLAAICSFRLAAGYPNKKG